MNAEPLAVDKDLGRVENVARLNLLERLDVELVAELAHCNDAISSRPQAPSHILLSYRRPSCC